MVRLARRKPIYPVAAALSGLVLLAAGFAWEAERRGARRRIELADAVADRVETARLRISDGQLDSADAELDAALSALRELPGESVLQASVLAEQAVVANLRKEWSAGLAFADRALSLLEQTEDPPAVLVASLLNSRAYALQGSGSEESRGASRIALEHARAHLATGDELRLDALLGWADELRRAGDAQEALATVRLAVAESRERDPGGEVLNRMLNEEALALVRMGRLEESVPSYREALEILSWHRGERHPAFAKVSLNLGATLFRLGRFDEAEREFTRSLAASRHMQDELFVAANQHFLGRIHCARGGVEDLKLAEAAAREAISLRERHELGMHTDRSRCLLGIVQARAGHIEQARATLTPLLTSAEPGYFMAEMEAEARHLLGALFQDAGLDSEARAHLERALELKRELFGSEHEDCRELHRRLTAGG